jgi:hypothetical protein
MQDDPYLPHIITPEIASGLRRIKRIRDTVVAVQGLAAAIITAGVLFVFARPQYAQKFETTLIVALAAFMIPGIFLMRIKCPRCRHSYFSAVRGSSFSMAKSCQFCGIALSDADRIPLTSNPQIMRGR